MLCNLTQRKNRELAGPGLLRLILSFYDCILKWLRNRPLITILDLRDCELKMPCSEIGRAVSLWPSPAHRVSGPARPGPGPFAEFSDQARPASQATWPMQGTGRHHWIAGPRKHWHDRCSFVSSWDTRMSVFVPVWRPLFLLPVRPDGIPNGWVIWVFTDIANEVSYYFIRDLRQKLKGVVIGNHPSPVNVTKYEKVS